jgi:hypothetical protein
VVHKAPFHDPNFIGIFAWFSVDGRWSFAYRILTRSSTGQPHITPRVHIAKGNSMANFRGWFPQCTASTFHVRPRSLHDSNHEGAASRKIDIGGGGYEFYPDMRARELQGWFSSAILRLAGVGLAIDFMQRTQVEMMSPFANRS